MRLRIVVAALLIGMTLTSCFKLRLSRQGVYSQVQPKEFDSMVTGKSVQLIDVRSPREYANGHLANAINIPYFEKDFSARVAALKLDTAETVFLYCMTQHRSPPASAVLKDLGFRSIVDLKGGYWKWKRKGFAE